MTVKVQDFCKTLNDSKELKDTLWVRQSDRKGLKRSLKHIKKCKIAGDYAISKIEEFLE